MSTPACMNAAILRVDAGRLATRNLTDFRTTGLEPISPSDLWVEAPDRARFMAITRRRDKAAKRFSLDGFALGGTGCLGMHPASYR